MKPPSMTTTRRRTTLSNLERLLEASRTPLAGGHVGPARIDIDSAAGRGADRSRRAPPIAAVVLGGGVSGLSAAHYMRRCLPESFSKIVVIERASRLGGWIDGRPRGGSSSSAVASPFFELGPHSLRPSPQSFHLLRDLKLLDEYLGGAGKARMLWADGKLSVLPNRLWRVFVNRYTWQLPFAVVREFVTGKATASPDVVHAQHFNLDGMGGMYSDETVADFFARKLGPKAAKELIPAICAGVFAGNPSTLSMSSCFRDFYRHSEGKISMFRSFVYDYLDSGVKNHQKHAKATEGKSQKEIEEYFAVEKEKLKFLRAGAVSFPGGMSKLVEALTAYSKENDVSFEVQTEVVSLQLQPDGKWSVGTRKAHKHAKSSNKNRDFFIPKSSTPPQSPTPALSTNPLYTLSSNMDAIKPLQDRRFIIKSDDVEDPLSSVESYTISYEEQVRAILEEMGRERKYPDDYVVADRVYSTLTPKQLIMALYPKSGGLEGPLRDLLLRLLKVHVSLEYASVAVINLHYKHSSPLIKGFGHLVSSLEEQKTSGVLGVIYDSVNFPAQQPRSILDEGGCVLTLMMGGALAPWVCETKSEAEITDLAVKAVERQLGFTKDKPAHTLCTIHRECIPQPALGHFQRVKEARRAAAQYGLVLLGTGFHEYGVGISDCLRNAREAVLNEAGYLPGPIRSAEEFFE